MIETFLRLKNIARFHDEGYDSLSFGDLNLVFAENGCGKTTLSAIMHSIAKNEPGFIEERATVDRSGMPEAKILTTNKDQLHFAGGLWSGPIDRIEINVFDSHFVNKNIYSGHTLSHDHKKKLHRFVIGERGQDLSDRIDRLDSVSRNAASHIREIEKDIDRKIESEGLTVDEFRELPKPEDLEKEIEEATAVVEGLKKASEIQEKDDLERPTLPEIPLDEIKALLATTLDDISESAESKVSEHISQCVDEGGERWVETGLSYLQDDECPFCGQDLQGVDLIEAYRDYFSEEYADLKSSVADLLQQVKIDVLPQGGWRSVDSAVDKNQSRHEFWEQRIDASHQVPSELSEQLKDVWNAVRGALVDLLEKKRSAPLDSIEIDQKTKEVLQTYESLRGHLGEYRGMVSDVNEKIEAFKSELKSGSVAEAKAALAHLEDCQSRHGEIGRDLSERLRLNQRRKERIEKAKDEAKEDLGEYQRRILSSCQEGINEFLRKAGADFRIRDANVGYQGGTANARFSIEINQEKIGLGNAVTEVGEQSFRNLLSDGDKNTFAFAFFYARIKEISDLDNRVIVIDDPISSLDEHRRGATRNAILELADRCKQIIVLSHSPRFLSNLWEESDPDDELDLFQIQKTGEKTSKLTEWEEDEMRRKVQDPYFRHFERLVAYKSKRQGDPVDVAHSIRHVLEGNLRRRFPDRYGKKDGSIGAFIGMVEDAADDYPLSDLQGTDYFEELQEIASSEYCHDPHHSDDPFLPEQINETELATCVKRTLEFARGVP